MSARQNIIAPSVAAPTLKIPTGYEGQQSSIATKRAMAKALLDQGLETKYNNWGDVVGALAKAWAGKSALRDSDKAQSTLNGQVQANYQSKSQEVNQLIQAVQAGQMTPADAWGKVAGDPIMEEIAKPMLQPAVTARTTSEGNIINNNGVNMTEGQSTRLNGGIQPSKPDDKVIYNPATGRNELNRTAVTAAILAGGHGLDPAHPGVSSTPQFMLPQGNGWPSPQPGGQPEAMPQAQQTTAPQPEASPQGELPPIDNQPAPQASAPQDNYGLPTPPPEAIAQLRAEAMRDPKAIDEFVQIFGPRAAQAALDLSGPTAQPYRGQ